MNDKPCARIVDELRPKNPELKFSYLESCRTTLKERLQLHRNDAKRGYINQGERVCNSKLYTKMREIGVDNWEIKPLIFAACTEKQIRIFEQAKIDELKPNLSERRADPGECSARIAKAKRNRENPKRHEKVFCDVCQVWRSKAIPGKKHDNHFLNYPRTTP